MIRRFLIAVLLCCPTIASGQVTGRFFLQKETFAPGEPGTYEHMKSAEFLAQSGDQKWFPLLLEVAQRNAKNGNYVYDAAESGGDLMLPTLLVMLGSSDKEFTRPIAVSAFAYTGSRSSIPILLDLLRSPDSGTAERALYGLRQLTHRSVIAGDRWYDNPQSQYVKWARWWNREGGSANVYKATECGEVIALDRPDRTSPPLFLVNADSRGLRCSLSSLESTLVDDFRKC